MQYVCDDFNCVWCMCMCRRNELPLWQCCCQSILKWRRRLTYVLFHPALVYQLSIVFAGSESPDVTVQLFHKPHSRTQQVEFFRSVEPLTLYQFLKTQKWPLPPASSTLWKVWPQRVYGQPRTTVSTCFYISLVWVFHVGRRKRSMMPAKLDSHTGVIWQSDNDTQTHIRSFPYFVVTLKWLSFSLFGRPFLCVSCACIARSHTVTRMHSM